MEDGSIVLVHGTGVRMSAYQASLALAERTAKQAGIGARFVPCAWGNALGIDFQGLSLPPDAHTEERELEREGEDFARWSWLIADPLCELEKLTIRDPHRAMPAPPPGIDPPWLAEWKRIAAYQPSEGMRILFERAGLDMAAWQKAWHAVTAADLIARTAFQRSAHELPVAGQALSRAVVAQLLRDLQDRGLPTPSRSLRDRMVIQLNTDWEVLVLAPSDFFVRGLKRLATGVLKRYRDGLTDAIAPFIGDILLYQAHGEEIRRFIGNEIRNAPAPVTVVAHSLGGVACFDLFALPGAPEIERLVTVGSQSPLFHEIGVLASLDSRQPLPATFPDWLNVYDRNDMLSYVAKRLFQGVEEFESVSGKPFPDSHSDYFGNDAVWAEIKRFMQP
ncbi:hypothetical protein PQR67_24125 [Paraburkholderia fungorum]|uniref:hypothetical protein n=1 Tax=Paraburkholderia fungorum TaxID=134537 RepID=UPI0038BBFD1D